jgi:hypothetical protein
LVDLTIIRGVILMNDISPIGKDAANEKESRMIISIFCSMKEHQERLHSLAKYATAFQIILIGLFSVHCGLVMPLIQI